MPDEQRDFFISFNSADESYAKAISDALRAEGFTTFFHPDDLEYGGYIPKWMNDALLNSRQMLALCSPEYMNGGAVYSEAERYARFWQDTRGEEFKLIPVVLKKVDFPPLLAVYKRVMAINVTPAQAADAVVVALKKPEEIKEREALRGTQPNEVVHQSAYVHTTRLPETGYERLVGREAELQRLDNTWLDAKINILSLVAEGGGGKSALVNEWLKRMQAHNYPGAEKVLGWSFFSQGTTERVTSAEEFLNWALEKLGIQLGTTSATDKADAIAEAMMKSRVLLLLDGVEPLQHGPGPQLGQLKDSGLRALLRRFAATPPGATHGLVVLTSRLEVKDLTRWQDGAAQTVYVDRLSDVAGAALLRDNGVRGTDKELEAAGHDFGGHPLALGLLASFLKETQTGDVRRRDHIRGLISDTDNPGHDHARRVMESYETEWLAGQPVLLAVMHMVGLFDRPASGNCLNALRSEPMIEGLTDQIVKLDDREWQRAVARLRDVQLLAPRDPAAPDALDAHPLVREWFGVRLANNNVAAWTDAHGRLYEHLRDTTNEGNAPTLEDLALLYQAIAHGCRAGRYEETWEKIYIDRICRRTSTGGIVFYAHNRLGALGSNLAALSWFFESLYDKPVVALGAVGWSWVLAEAGTLLRVQGRFGDALPALRAALKIAQDEEIWPSAEYRSHNLSQAELHVGEIAAAVATAKLCIGYSDLADDEDKKINSRANLAEMLHASGQREESERFFAEAEGRRVELDPEHPILGGGYGYSHNEFLLANGSYVEARDRATKLLEWETESQPLVSRALARLTLGTAHLGLALQGFGRQRSLAVREVQNARRWIDEAVDGLRRSGQNNRLPRGLFARAVYHRGIGDWDGAARDLDEVEEIAEPGPMRPYLCDTALERARLAFAKIEAFAPLNGLINDSLPKPQRLDEEARKSLYDEATEQLGSAANYIKSCGYYRRAEELDELQAVLRSEKTFAELPPRV